MKDIYEVCFGEDLETGVYILHQLDNVSQQRGKGALGHEYMSRGVKTGPRYCNTEEVRGEGIFTPGPFEFSSGGLLSGLMS